MFCPKCGIADQKENSYCRSCGKLLPDFNNKNKKRETPEDQFQTSLMFNVMSAFAALSMAIMLYVFHLGNKNTHWSVYLAAALLVSIASWQIASYFINRKLKKRFIREQENDEPTTKSFQTANTKRSLNKADFSDVVPTSVTENTTRQLSKNLKNKSTHSEH